MRPPKEFVTPRLRLRTPRLEDAEAIFKNYAQDPEVVKFLTWEPHQSVEQTRAFLQVILNGSQAAVQFPYVIELRPDGPLLGMIECRREGTMADLGCVLAKVHWGKGYMTEAVKALVDWGLSQNDIFRIWSMCDLENPASARVMEKAGMTREGILRRRMIHPNVSDEPRDVYCYSIVK
jgi:ribosomal-protein-alanine N-acetyltransferase